MNPARRPLLLALLATLPLGACASLTPHRPLQRNVNVLLGARFADDDLEPLEDQGLVGLEVDVRERGRALGYELGLNLGGDSKGVGDVDIDILLYELFGGVRATGSLAGGRLQPYVAAGLSLVLVDFEVSDEDFEVTLDTEEDVSAGAYVRAGVTWRVTDVFRIGIDARAYRGTQVDLGADLDVDFEQIALVLGWAF